MRPRFYITLNPDSDCMYWHALLAAGYDETDDPAQADFIVHDSIHKGVVAFLGDIPSFIVPHTPVSCFLWDGINKVYPTKCNFVAGDGCKKIMQSYGYPFRIEPVGFNRCEVKAFAPTTGNDLLIVPAHKLDIGRYTDWDYASRVVAVLRFVVENRDAFRKVNLCWKDDSIDLSFAESKGINIIRTDPYIDREPLKHMMERIEQHDLIMGCGTAACVAVAMGRPTVFMTEKGSVPGSYPQRALHSELYVNDLIFPLWVEDMTIDEVLAVRSSPNSKVEYWKSQIIGGNFDANKFISIVKEYIHE